MFARGYAFIAGFDTTFVVVRLHNVSPFFLFLYQGTSRRYGTLPWPMRGLRPTANGSCRELSFVALSDPACASSRRDANQLCVHAPHTENSVSLELALKVPIETFSLWRWRSLFRTAQFVHVSHQRPVVKRE